MACMKHFACNSMEEARFRVDVTVDERALHEVYLPHFRRVADEGVASVMSAYNSVNGNWCGENTVLLTDILRTEWGWDGFVTSDFIAGLHDPVLSVTAGLEIEMPFRQQRAQHLPAAVADGPPGPWPTSWPGSRPPWPPSCASPTCSTAAPDRVGAGLAGPPGPGPGGGRRSMVLLRNEGGLLPVAPDLGRVAVLGRLAAVPNLGDGGSSDVYPPEVSTLLDGVRGAFPSADVVHHDTDALGRRRRRPGRGGGRLHQGRRGRVHRRGDQRVDDDHVPAGTRRPRSRRADARRGRRPDAGRRRRRRRPTPDVDARADDDAPARRPSPRAATAGPCASAATTRRWSAAAVAVCPRTVVAVMGGSAVVMPWLDDVPATLHGLVPGDGGRAGLRRRADRCRRARWPPAVRPADRRVPPGRLRPGRRRRRLRPLPRPVEARPGRRAGPPALRCRPRLHHLGGRSRVGPGRPGRPPAAPRDGSRSTSPTPGTGPARRSSSASPGCPARRSTDRPAPGGLRPGGPGGRRPGHGDPPVRPGRPWPCAGTAAGSRSRGATSLEVGTDAGPAVADPRGRRDRRRADACRSSWGWTAPPSRPRSSCATPTTARWSARPGRPHPAVHPPRSEQDPEAWWEALRLAAAEATADGAHAVAAVSVAAQQHGMVVLGRRRVGRCARPSCGTTPSRRPRRPTMVARLGARAWADAHRIGPGGRLHRHQAGVAGPPRARTPPGRSARCCCRTTT